MGAIIYFSTPLRIYIASGADKYGRKRVALGKTHSEALNNFIVKAWTK